MTLGEEAVAIRLVLRTHPGSVDDALRVAQRPARISVRFALGAIADLTSSMLRRLFGRKRAGSKALLERGFLAARMNPRRTAAWCAKVAPLSERESLNPRAARDQLDDDPVAAQALREILPGVCAVDCRENRCALRLDPLRRIDRLLRELARRRELPEAPLERRQRAARIDPRRRATRCAALETFGECQTAYPLAAPNQLRDDAVSSEALMQFAPALRAIDGVEHVGTRAFAPRQLAALAQLPIRAVTQASLWVRRRRIQMPLALHDVPIMVPDDDLPSALGRDFRTGALALDPLVPEVVRLAILTDAVGDDVGVVVVGVLMCRQHVLIALHADRFEQPFRIADDLCARWMLALSIGDDQMVNRILAAPREHRDRFHLECSCLDRSDAAQLDPSCLLRCARVADAVFERARCVRTSALAGMLGDVVDASCKATRARSGWHRFGDHDVTSSKRKSPARMMSHRDFLSYIRIIMRA